MTTENKTISIEKIIELSVKLLRGNKDPEVEDYRRWAEKWVDEEDQRAADAAEGVKEWARVTEAWDKVLRDNNASRFDAQKDE